MQSVARGTCPRQRDFDNRIEIAPVRTPTGSVVGRIVQRGAARVFERRVREKHRFREADAWSISDSVLAQLVRWRVVRVCYRGDDGLYEVPLAFFTAHAETREFERGERQHLLARRLWPVRPSESGLATVEQQTTHVEQVDLLAAVAW